MDIDRYILRNEPTWVRLDQLTKVAQRGVGKLEPAQLEEMVQLYQRTSAHLSYVRTHLREPTLISRLTRLVATANGIIYGKRTKSLSTVGRFLTLTYPGAVYHARRAIGVWPTRHRHAAARRPAGITTRRRPPPAPALPRAPAAGPASPRRRWAFRRAHQRSGGSAAGHRH